MALGTLETSKVERVPQYAAGPVFITQRQCSRAPAGWWSIAAIVGSAGRGRVYRDVRAWPGRAPPSTVRGFRQPATSAHGPGHTETSTVIARRPADPDTRRPQPTVRTGRATVALHVQTSHVRRRTRSPETSLVARHMSLDAKCSRAPAEWRSITERPGSAGRGGVYRDVRAWPGRAQHTTVRGFRQAAASAPVPATQKHPLSLPNNPLILTRVDHNRRCARAGLRYGMARTRATVDR